VESRVSASTAAKDTDISFPDSEPATAPFQGFSPSNFAMPNMDSPDWLMAATISFSPREIFQMPCTLALLLRSLVWVLLSAPVVLEAFAVSFASGPALAVEASCTCPKHTDTINANRRTDVTPKYPIFKSKTSDYLTDYLLRLDFISDINLIQLLFERSIAYLFCLPQRFRESPRIRVGARASEKREERFSSARHIEEGDQAAAAC
jgi:hypothetical protein